MPCIPSARDITSLYPVGIATILSLSRVFTFGIGSGVSTALVKGLAKAGNGTAEFIHEGERLHIYRYTLHG